MKTKIIFFRIVLSYIIFLLCSASSYTQVWEVAGEISADSTWTGDTIKVTGDVTVVDNVILTIKPGTYIKFMGHYKLDIYGTLLAVGTETDSIRFSVNDSSGFHQYGSSEGGWNGIIFNNSGDMGGANGAMNDNDTSKIQYCQFEFAKGLIYNFVGSGGAVRLDNFDRLAIPFRAVATDMGTGKPVVLGDGKLAAALRASMAVPGGLAPEIIDGRMLVDHWNGATEKQGIASPAQQYALFRVGPGMTIVAHV